MPLNLYILHCFINDPLSIRLALQLSCDPGEAGGLILVLQVKPHARLLCRIWEFVQNNNKKTKPRKHCVYQEIAFFFFVK